MVGFEKPREVGTGNEYNQNALVENQPQAIVGDAFEFEFRTDLTS